jgi:hypothetical protein
LCKTIALKKVITIFFLAIYLFNLAGYQGLFVFFDNAISTHIVTQLDKGEYNDAELVEIKIPYPLPYAANWPDYQRFDGEADINGMHYNYVKRKMSNDTLYLLCIPNHERTKLAAAKNEYVKNTTEGVNTAPGKKSPASSGMQKAFSGDYNNLIAEYKLPPSGISLTLAYHAAQPGPLSAYSSTPFQPPKA